MKLVPLFCLLMLATPVTSAEEVMNNLHIGKWRIAPEWAEWFQPECRDMEIEITDDNRIIRTTGELVYETAVSFAPARKNRIQLDEKLVTHNSKSYRHGQAPILPTQQSGPQLESPRQLLGRRRG